MNDKVTRRGFVAGTAAAAGVAAVAGAAGAGMADEAEAGQTGQTGWSWEAGPEAVAEGQITAAGAHDYVVVGAGIAGLSTAASLAENGADVIVLEKTETWSSRGATIAHFGSLNCSRWEAAGVHVDKFDVYRNWDAQNNSRMKPELVWTFLNRSGEALDWAFDVAEKEQGCTINLLGTHYFGEFYPEYYGTCMVVPPEELVAKAKEEGLDLGMGNALHYSLYLHAIDNGAQFVFQTRANQLVQADDGTVTGVLCQDEDGAWVRYDANKGVILATGDCTADEEMNACFSPLMNRCKSVGYIPMGANSGDGQKMQIWAGAKMQETPWPPMIHPQGYGMFLGPFMMTNAYGKRFMNEDTWTQGKSLGILEQPGEVDYGFCVFDGNYSEDLYNTRLIGGGLMWDSVWRVYGDDSTCEDYNATILQMCEVGGYLYQGDTVEEAAAAVAAEYPDFDADAFVAEVARYNELVAAGEDEDYGKRADLLLPIAQPPFYIEKVGPNRMCAPGGALIDAKGEVLKEGDEPIPGLYAVGNCSGGLYAVDYPLVINGNSHGRCITFGYLLGRQLTGVE